MIKYPEERKTEHIEYILSKYLDKQELFKVVFQMTDEKFDKLLNVIKGEG